MATRPGVRVSACVRTGAAWCTFLREQGDTDCFAGTRVPHPPLCHHLLSLPRSHRPAEALLRTRFSVPLSTNATATKEGATLQQAVS